VGFECYRIGDLLLDAGTQEVSRDGSAVPVPRLSFMLLLSLARHAPNVVSAQQLVDEVWPGLVVDRGTVSKRVLLLRKALDEDKGEYPYIAVIRGCGYRLVAQVERLESISVEPAQADESRQNWYQRSAGAMRTFSYGLLIVVAVLVLSGGYRTTSVDSIEPGIPGQIDTAIQPILAAYEQKSIAVLPFVDLSDGHINQYLGDGIAEAVINLLAGMDGLAVAARTSSFAFRDTTSTAVGIAAKLRVGMILEGSIRLTDGRIRVTTQLIDTQTGYDVWSKNYDRTFDEVFEVQDDIAFNIAQSLKLTLDESGQPDSRVATTGDIEALTLYLKGRELLNARMHLRTEGLRQALDYFQKAVEQDSGFAKAHAGAASVYWLLTSYDDSLNKEDYFELSETSANFALEFNPVSTDALGSLASIHAARGDIKQAAVLFERIRTIGSNDSNIAHWEAMLLIRLGYFDELIDPLTEVYRLDPFNEHIAWSLAAALNFSGRPAEAASILQDLKHFTYRQYVLGLTAINQKNYSQAREFLRDTRMRSGVLPAIYADWLIDALENPALSEEVAQKFISAVKQGDLAPCVSFESLLILGSPHAFDLKIDPLNDLTRIQIHAQIWNNWGVAIRQDPRFKDWVEKLGYAGFWRKNGWPDRCRPTGPDDFECI
jgi:TolB-like protein/DNA-binding winged helix-turn-helix (wHTH) protein/Flp pilus assembly protein TadD